MRLPFVHEMFSLIAESYPELVAVESGHGPATYREIDNRSNQVAAAAASAGVARNDLVVIFAEDRRFIIETVLGVLKAGGAFVPFSPSLPMRRLELLLDECSPEWAIVQPELVESFSGIGASRSIQTIFPDIAGNHDFQLDTELDGDGLSYIFFTSGSTGRPKAIAGRLKAIDHFIRWEVETFGLGPGSRVSQLMSPMFDAFMRDIFVPLCSGGTVCIPDSDELLLDGNRLGKWLDEQRINLVHTVPSVFRQMLNHSNGDRQWKDLRYVLLSGEPLLPSDVKRWYGLVGSSDVGRLVNLYGPTETTMTKFVYVVEEADHLKNAVPIGKPMKGAKAVVLDRNGRICAPWKIGELYIRTPYRSLGYYGRQDLTDEVFVPNPFSHDPADLVYKTGDLARVIDDGNFELLGRRDAQVKIRGVRIELEEIEAALSDCEGIGQAAVTVREDGSGDKRLVAFVVALGGTEITGSDIRRALKEHLPEYMLPSAWVLLEKLPLTLTGKVDRQALNKLEVDFNQLGNRGGLGPRTPVEEILCGIWQDVLKIPAIGLNDNFFELGGHSLLATQLMSRVVSTFSVDLPLRMLFEAPTVKEMARHIDQAKRKEFKSDLLQIERVDGSMPLPLSYAQQRLWFVDQLEPGGVTYNMPWTVRIRGSLDVQLLERSLNEVVRRHASLRTCFVAEDGEPRQVIEDALNVRLPVFDLDYIAPEGREQEARRLIQRDFDQVFDLARTPLFRARLLRITEHDHVLCIVIHHIIADGWSIAILVRELLTIYQALRAGQASSLPELPIQYPDFAAWQRKSLAGETLDQELAYWRETVEGVEPLQLPCDHPRPTSGIHRGGVAYVGFDLDETARMREMAGREGMTLFMLLLTGMEVLLWRYSGQTDLVIGTDAANRHLPQIEGLIGCFVNQLVLRVKLEEGISGLELARRVRETTLAAYEHEDLPFERLVQELQLERNSARAPLFQVVFAWQTLFKEELELPGFIFERFAYPERPAKLDLTVMLDETTDGIRGMIEYSAELYEQTTVERMAKDWKHLVTQLLASPDLPISEYSLLSSTEQLAVLERTVREEPYPSKCAHELFEEQAARNPESIAVTHEDGQLTYGEINDKANRVASCLASLNVGREECVAVFLERSAELLTVMLGILKVGGVYLPLDPGYPEDRLLYMTANAGAAVLITTNKLRNRLAAYSGKVICLEEQGEIIELDWPDNPISVVNPENLAYVMYTSGSTGKPKGAMVEHHGMLNHLLAKIRDLGLDKWDVVAQNASSSFDISVWQFLAPLLAGGRVHIVSNEIANNAWETLKEVRTHGVTILETVPTMLAAMLGERERARDTVPSLDSLRWIICNAEALSSRTANQWLDVYQHVRLVNTYGATECSDDTSHCWIQELLPADSAYAPLGRPIANTSLYVLDSSKQLVPAGVAGESYIGGACVGRGYVGNPALTAERFLPDAFAAIPGSRLYRTGDRIRWSQDGNFEFLGRVDFQVKIRGHRIELGEVEATLRKHQQVEEAVALVREDNPGQKELVAYAVPKAPDNLQEPRDGKDLEKVESWRQVFSEVYQEPAAGQQDAAINTRIWISSYTGKPFPEEEVLECVDDTVGRILALNPKRVLEIGCGSGLLLSRVAPRCEKYYGTDFSGEALSAARNWATSQGLEDRVTLLHQSADNFHGIPLQHFDVVVLNEVAQYFPSVHYLINVFEQMMNVASPHGCLFLGGLRNLHLLDAFHTSVELHRADGSTPINELRRRIRKEVGQEKELLVAPELFTAIKDNDDRISAVQIQLKGGHSINEFTKFRYDVILRLGSVRRNGNLRWLDWSEQRTSLSAVRNLIEVSNEAVGFTKIPNARIWTDVFAVEMLSRMDGNDTVQDLREQLLRVTEPVEVPPAQLWLLGNQLSRAVTLNWAGPKEPGFYQAIFHATNETVSEASLPSNGNGAPKWDLYANQPLRKASTNELGRQLRDFLRATLPDYMVPSAVVMLESIPLTANGKVDRKSLPEPHHRSERGTYEKPRSAEEEMLCGILEEVLQVPRVGVNDNFFDLGGHSLLATQVVSRVRNIFRVDLALQVLFEMPTVEQLARQITAARADGDMPAPPLVRAERTKELPLSYAQQRLWFIDQLQPGNAAYNAPFALRFTGRIDMQALRQSINEIIRRHEVLRTSFPIHNGKPVQEILPEMHLQIDEVDLSHVPEGIREEEAQRLVQMEAGRPFDLARAPLVRVKLLRFGEQDHVLFVNMHHIVSDGWSMGIVVREFVQLYDAYARRLGSPLQELPIQYADFSIWQRQWLQGAVLEDQLDYWHKQLEGIETLNLPTDHPRPAAPSHNGGIVSFVIPYELTESLRALSRREGVTLFMTLLAALQVTLCKYSGQRDIAVGTAVANRNRAEIERLIGFFVNTLVMRTLLAGSWSFTRLLNRVRQVALDAYQHQDVPFEKLVEQLQPERDLSRSPLFQVLLVLQNVRMEQLQIPGLHLSEFPAGTDAAKFDLMFTLTEGAEGITGELSYARDLYERETIQRLLTHFHIILEKMVTNPEQRIGETSLLTDAERSELLLDRNETSAVYDPGFVHQLFLDQVLKTPDAVAVQYAGRMLTYADLNHQANKVANGLRFAGAGAETLVGVCLHRSLEMPISLLGVLKAGAAYVPLDPNYPAERLQYLISDSGVGVVLSSDETAPALSGTTTRIMKIDELLTGYASGEEAETGGELTQENPAYVIYTSGSTGKPKGAMITHRGLYNHMLWMQQAYPLQAGDRILQKTLFTFDASVWEFYAPLLSGAVLVMAEPGGHQEPEYLVECLKDEAITILQLVPTQLRLLLKQPGLEHCYDLRRVYCGGEALTRDLVQAFYHCLPWATLCNLYGPTETTIQSVTGDCDSDHESATAPIGRPIANTQLYVLDEDRQPLPPGAAGELYIGGAGLGRGYLHRPVLTAEKFVPNPFGTDGGQRLYRTGDRVRWLRGGKLEFLGRLDHQVKVRGHRIELGEIETALLVHPGVEQAVVEVQQDSGGRLVAYVVADMEGTFNSAELRRFLQDKLPDYAIPAVFIQLAKLPLTPNGKLDRKSLPLPVLERGKDESYVAPRNQVEEVLCGIWAKLLNVEQVGIRDNFFELGGDSILSIQVISQAREAGLHLTARQMFERQTIAELSEVVRIAAELNDPGSPTLDFPLAKVPREDLERWIGDGEDVEDIYPLTPMQLGLMFHTLYESSDVYFVQLSCLLRGGIDPIAFRRAWEEVVQRHAILRTAFLWEGLEEPAQTVWKHIELPWRQEDWRNLNASDQDERWQTFLREDREQGFDFQQAPLLRLALIRTGEQSYYFAWSTHHMLIDGWSRQILTREVFTLYQSYLRGDALQLPAPPKYRNYVGWLQSRDDQQAEVFWREELRGFTTSTRLGFEQIGRELEKDEPAHGELIRALDRDFSEKLEEFARSQRVTLNTVIQGAWALVLSRYSGQHDVVFGATVSGRPPEIDGIEQMVGLFINTLPVRVQMKDQEPVGCYLQRIQARQAEAREYEYSPLVKVQSWSEVRGMLLFDSLVVFENYPADSVLRRQVGQSIKVESLQAVDQTNYPLTLIAVPGEAVLLNLLYSRRILEQRSLERLLDHLHVALMEMIRGAEQPVSQISLMSEAERRQLLVEWNWTGTVNWHGGCVHLFDEQAARTPEARAVEYKGQALTYRELNQRANQLGHYLRRLGVEPEVRVGICLDRSLEMVIAMLGIMKAGGAYVPIDPNYPRDRIDYILRDSQTPVLLTRHALPGHLPASQGTVVSLDESWDEIAKESTTGPRSLTEPENLAYVIYTSGSTGRPKGVAIRHGSVDVFLSWAHEAFSSRELSAVFASTSICFDLSVFEIFAPLTRGGTVVLAANALDLDEIERASGITLINTVPSAVRELLRMKAVPTSVQVVNLAGEALSAGLVREIYELENVERVLNLYGPSEDTTYSTFASLRLDDSSEMAPIGKPIAGTQAYVLGKELEPVPIGIAGELFLGGAGLARAYLNRPELTAESFVPSQFSEMSGQRLYRTGDLVRYRPDGVLEFIGRADHQVKIRGHRIELGEIEVALEALKQVEQAVVVVREDGAGDKRLVAYVTVAEQVTSGEMRKALRQRLPEFMLPSLFIRLDALPLTPNGKIDRKALPAPIAEHRADGESYVAPRNRVEEILCGIWRKILKVDEIGVHDNFFELGGDSILSIQVIARAREAGLQMTPRQIFEHPTVAQLAEVAGIEIYTEPDADTESTGNARPVPLTPIQAAFFEWALEKPSHYNQAVMLELKPGVDCALLERVIRGLLLRHDALRMRYEPGEQGWQQWCEERAFDDVYERKDLSDLQGSKQRTEMEQDADRVHRSLDLHEGRLVRVVEYDLGSKHGKRLLLVIHHLVVDGVSWRILLQDLERGYEQLKVGESLDSGPKTTSMRRWAEGIKGYSKREQLKQELEYWCAAPRKLVKPLPLDYQPEAGARGTGRTQRTVTMFLDENETKELLQDVPKVYHTQINDVLLTALAWVCAEWTGSRQVLVNMEGHGREDVLPGADLSQTVGWFTTIYPLLLETDEEWTPGSALKNIKEQLHRLPNRGFGYGVLRYMHDDESVRRELAKMPAAEISFNYLGQFDQVFKGSNLFAPAQEPSGHSVAGENRSLHVVDVGGIVVGGRLQMNWSYDETLHRRETIEKVARGYMERLRQIIEHCGNNDAYGYTPSDFPLANLTEERLSQLAAALQTESEQV